jgi:hypothetical protein
MESNNFGRAESDGMISQLSAQGERSITAIGIRNSAKPELAATSPAQPERAKSASSNSVKNQDSVVLSEEARQLSATVRDPKRTVAPGDNEPPQKAEEPKEKTTYAEVVKYFPPYLGNLKRLEILRNYPQLLHEVESMMVPPPYDLLATTVTTDQTTPPSDTPKKNDVP